MIGNLSGRVVATTAAICLFAVALTAGLNFYKFQSTLEELLRSRFAFLLRDMRNTLETGIEIKVPLFIKEGEKVKVSTETREFAGRA